MQACASFAQSGSCTYGSRCRFMHPHDSTPCNSSPVRSFSNQTCQTAHQEPTSLASYGTDHCSHRQPVLPPPILTPSNASLPPLSCCLDKLPQPGWKLTCSAGSMLPQYSATLVPTPCQDIISQLWPTKCTQEPANPVYVPMTTTQPANTKHNKAGCPDKLPWPCDEYNIWAATDPFAHVRAYARDAADAVMT